MKKLLTILAFLPLLAVAQGTGAKGTAKTVTKTTGPGFVVDGSVKGLAEGSRVFLTDANNPSDTLAKGFVRAGKFVLKGHVKEPNLYEINFGSAKKKSPLFLGNDPVTITGSVEDLKGLSVTGSPSNDDFVTFQQTFNPYFAKLNALGQMANSPDGAKKGDSISRVYKGVVDTIETALDQFIQDKRSSYVSPFVMIVLAQLNDDPMRQEKRFGALAPEIQASFYGQYLQKQIAEAKIGAIGTPAIDFSQNDTAGRPVALSSYKGKYVLVDFWASWCGPCRMENPNVLATFNKFKNKNFTVLGVSLDKARDPWLKAIKDDQLAWTQVSDLKFWYNEVAVKYHIQSIPQNFLIDPDGKIVGRNLRGSELQSKLCELLGCN
ncbi:MAG: TlpA disulfide reductase family protein [Puia sp.]|nr:TlpA disulfide reductase family protein [Puia sp.]